MSAAAAVFNNYVASLRGRIFGISCRDGNPRARHEIPGQGWHESLLMNREAENLNAFLTQLHLYIDRMRDQHSAERRALLTSGLAQEANGAGEGDEQVVEEVD